MQVLVLHPRASIIKVHIVSSINVKACIALVSANPATITLGMQTVTSLERVEMGTGCVIQLAGGKNL